MMAPGELPPALQAWRTWLGWFDLELALVLGELVKRLSELAGPANGAGGRATQEPDGLGDLRSRGAYERLLASEWLLAEDMPEEFLRRATSAEHLFLAPSLRAAQAERRVVAIFDGGPRQLGPARVAHVAAWVLLARRAADLGGSLNWGMLHEPGRLYDATDPSRLRQLLQARTLVPGDDTHVQGWRDALVGASDGAQVETWWIGVPARSGMPGPARGERRLAFLPMLDPGGLEAVLTTVSERRQTQLQLPPGPQAAALLRGSALRKTTVHAPAGSPRDMYRMALTRAPLFTRFGARVGVPALSGDGLLVFPVSPHHKGKVQRQAWSRSRMPVAVTLKLRQAMAVCQDASQMHFWQVDGFASCAKPPADQFEAASEGTRWLPMHLLGSSGHRRVCVVDRRGRLLVWETRLSDKSAPQLRRFDEDVLGLLELEPGHLLYAVAYGGGLWLRSLQAIGSPSPLLRRLCPLEKPRPPVLMAVAMVSDESMLGALAVRLRAAAAEVWHVMTMADPLRRLDAVDGAIEHTIELSPGERAMGLLCRKGMAPLEMVVRTANKQSLRLVSPTGWRPLYTAQSPIRQCTVCPTSGRVAILTGARELIVLDPMEEAPLLVVKDAEEPQA